MPRRREAPGSGLCRQSANSVREYRPTTARLPLDVQKLAQHIVGGRGIPVSGLGHANATVCHGRLACSGGAGL